MLENFTLDYTARASKLSLQWCFRTINTKCALNRYIFKEVTENTDISRFSVIGNYGEQKSDRHIHNIISTQLAEKNQQASKK